MSHRLAPLLLAAAVVVVGVLPWRPAGAATTQVQVRDGAYEPSSVTVRVGDRVTWTWVTEQPNSVSSVDGSFDSHPDCAIGAPDACGRAPQTFTWSPETSGTYSYRSRATPGMVGTVVVEEAPAASPSPTGSEPSGDPTPTSEPAPKRTTTAPDQGDGQSPADEPEPTPTPSSRDGATSSPRSAPTRGRAAGPNLGSTTLTPTPPGTDEPAVAAPSPRPTTPLEPFPSASPIPSSTADTVTLAAEGGGAGGRTLWLALGSASVLGTAGAFGRLVLFGPTWR